MGLLIMVSSFCVGTPIRDEAYCLQEYLDNIKPLFDDVIAIVDDRTVDNSIEILEANGVNYKTIKFVDFGQMGNALMSFARELGIEFLFILNPDERIEPDIAIEVKDFIGNNKNIDLFYMARKNWYDKEKTKERTDVFPDLQCKIVKVSNKSLKYAGKVHETIYGVSTSLVLPLHLFTDHFNLYYYSTGEQNYDKKIEQYNRLSHV